MAADELTTHDIAGARDAEVGLDESASNDDERAAGRPSLTPQPPPATGNAQGEPSAPAAQGVPDRGGVGEDDNSPAREPDRATTATGAAGDLDLAGRSGAGGDRAGLDADASGTTQESLLPADQTERFTSRWQQIQTGFVDEPRRAVEEADALVAHLMQRLAAGFSNERERLESQWDRGDDVSTEELRVALTRYRSFFDRLLSA
jgi:hypothetical protein